MCKSLQSQVPRKSTVKAVKAKSIKSCLQLKSDLSSRSQVRSGDTMKNLSGLFDSILGNGEKSLSTIDEVG